MPEQNKIAVVIYEPASGNSARVYRALRTAAEFDAAGDDVVIVFDGSGVEYLAALSDASNPMHPLLMSLKDRVRGGCAYCAGAHKVKPEIEAAGWALLNEAKGEASIRDLVLEGRQVLNY